MSRFKRLVVPHCPHHITNRGNRRQRIFFSDEDKIFYLGLLHKYGNRFGLEFWAYCLMNNHVHLVAVPEKPDSMYLTIREAHRKYSIFINLKMNWQGTLWQRRYYSSPLESNRILPSFRYIENNPVRAGIVKTAEEYPWSSARAHVLGTPDDLLSPHELGIRRKEWQAFLRKQEVEDEFRDIRERTKTGRPLGGDEFILQLEETFKRTIQIKKRGRE